MASPALSRSSADRRPRLGREAWIEAARSALVEGGIGRVKVERLAEALGVTTGSFYWHFRDRGELLEALLDDWAETNTEAMAAIASDRAASAEARFDAIIDMWVNQAGFSPAYDSAMRDWARLSKAVETAVVAVDRKRIALLKRLFLDLGYGDERAEVRARIMYFHQVGYYALGIREKEPVRLKLRPFYVEALRDGPGRKKG